MKDERPSLTARAVALQRSRLDRPAGIHGNPEAEQRLYHSIRIRTPVHYRGRNFMAERTEFFDEETMGAIERGIRQIVIIGAGYDGRALRFRDPQVRFFELDHPNTQSDKRRRMHDLDITAHGLSFVELDLMTSDVNEALDKAGHDPRRDTLFIAEGLLGYLDQESIDSLFVGLRRRSTGASRFATNFWVSPNAPTVFGKARRLAIRSTLRVIGESFGTEFHPGDPERILERTGWLPNRCVNAAMPFTGRSFEQLVALDPSG